MSADQPGYLDERLEGELIGAIRQYVEMGLTTDSRLGDLADALEHECCWLVLTATGPKCAAAGVVTGGAANIAISPTEPPSWSM